MAEGVYVGGTSHNDTLYGTPNDDRIYGWGGHDTLIGCGGRDWLDSGHQNDLLDGGADGDGLTGGTGSDVFVFRKGQADEDVILDFMGNAAAAGDSVRFEGSGPEMVLQAQSGDHWQIYDGGTEVIAISDDLHSSDYTFV